MGLCQNVLCSKLLIDKRADAKYCSEKCKNKVNNLNKKTIDDWFDVFNKKLRENYMILKVLYNKNHQVIDVETLKSEGFNFNYLNNSKCNDQICHFQIHDLSLEINGYNCLIRKS